MEYHLPSSPTRLACCRHLAKRRLRRDDEFVFYLVRALKVYCSVQQCRTSVTGPSQEARRATVKKSMSLFLVKGSSRVAVRGSSQECNVAGPSRVKVLQRAGQYSTAKLSSASRFRRVHTTGRVVDGVCCKSSPCIGDADLARPLG